MSQRAFERAKQLIKEKRYKEARSLLSMIQGSPVAEQWIKNIDKLIDAQQSTPKVPPEEMDEVRDFHPLVAIWLAQHGYQFKHEFTLTNGIRVDFLATHMSTKQVLTVECKININRPDDFRRAIVQATDYQVSVGGGADAALAIPENQVRDGWQALCDRHHVQLILIDTSSIEPPKPPLQSPKLVTPHYTGAVQGYRIVNPTPPPISQPSTPTNTPQASFYQRYGFWIGFNSLLFLLLLCSIALSTTDELVATFGAFLITILFLNGMAYAVIWMFRKIT